MRRTTGKRKRFNYVRNKTRDFGAYIDGKLSDLLDWLTYWIG